MLSSSSSSSSSSGSESSSSNKSDAKPRFSSNDAVEIVKPSLLGKHPNEATLNDYKSIQLTREQIFNNFSSPFFDELLADSYVRVVSGVR